MKIIKFFTRLLEIVGSETREYLSFTGRLIAIRYRKWKLNRAIKIAEEKSLAEDGRRYYVILDWNDSYRVINKREINIYKKAGALPKDFDILKRLNECVYFTKNKSSKIK